MIKNTLKGKFILFEGLDEAGKTTAIEGVAESMAHNYDIFYCKGLGPNSFLRQAARHFPSTLLVLLGLVYAAYFLIIPALRKKRIVLQDRYIFTVASYVPSVERAWNKFFVKLFSPLLLGPDLIFYFQVSMEERLKRLKKSSEVNRFHQALIDNPRLIIKREDKMRELLLPYGRKTIIVDTTNKGIKETRELVAREITSFLKRGY